MNDADKPITIVNEYTNKYQVLKWIFDKSHFRYNDELLSFKRKLTGEMDYNQLAVFNTLFELIKDNVLENIAALGCVKIIIDK